MGREEGFTVLSKVRLIGFNHAIHPGKKFFGTMVGVKHHRDAVVGSHLTDVHCQGDRTSSTCVLILDGLTSHELSTSVGNLDDDGGIVLCSSFQASIGSGRTTVVEQIRH